MIFKELYKLTAEGTDILTAQYMFVFVYIFTQACAMFLVYKPAKVPPYVLPLLVLSKRLHSIYMLRMFNDVFSTLFAIFSIAALQRKLWTLSAVALSFAISVKMNSLLYLPAAALIYLQALGPFGTVFRTVVPFVTVQGLVAREFLYSGFEKEYFSKAFEFSRVFFYKWTVNWRFVPEETFLSSNFAIALLSVHALLLIAFSVRRGSNWLLPMGSPSSFARSRNEIIAIVRALLFAPSAERSLRVSRMTPDYVLTTMVSCNLIGILCARSLHYQFYSWFFWAVPFALYKVQGVFGFVVALGIFVAQELAWLTFPSTNQSSYFVVFSLLAMVIALWISDFKSSGPAFKQIKTKSN